MLGNSQKRLCRKAPTRDLAHAFEDFCRGTAVELLERDGAGQRLERWLSNVQQIWSNALDDISQYRISGFEVFQ